jgi:hypothetical protein
MSLCHAACNQLYGAVLSDHLALPTVPVSGQPCGAALLSRTTEACLHVLQVMMTTACPHVL